MMKKPFTKRVYEGGFVADVDVGQIITDEGWSPYLALKDAPRLDDVRDALRGGISRGQPNSRVSSS
jgi:hypothetical protein